MSTVMSKVERVRDRLQSSGGSGDGESGGTFSFSLKLLVMKILSLVVVGGVLYLLRGTWTVHALVYNIMFSPLFTFGVGVPLLFGVALYLFPSFEQNSTSRKLTYFGTVFVLFLIIGIGIAFLGSMFAGADLANDTMESSVEVETPPSVNADNPRAVPRSVADVQTRGSTSYDQYQLGVSDIARMEDGSLGWGYPVQTDQFRNRVTGNQQGVLISDMTTTDTQRIERYDNQEFTYGTNMVLHRSAAWNVRTEAYFSEYNDDFIPFVHEGNAYMAIPQTGHEWRQTMGIPYTVPVWDGVALVHSDGTIDNLSPEEARESEILDGQRIYPLYNTEVRAESLRYRNGILNQLPGIGQYDNVVVPAGMPDYTGNEQPFVIDLEGEQQSYVYAFEAEGSSSRGLSEIWFFNGETGTPQYYSSGEQSLSGPERALGAVRSSSQDTNWAGSDTPETGEFQVAEPIPTVVDGEIWWHTKVIPAENTDVSTHVFVNAETRETQQFTTTAAVVEFIGGADAEDIDDTEEGLDTSGPSQGPSSTYVVIRGSGGDVIDTIPIGSGQSISIEQCETNTSESQACS